MKLYIDLNLCRHWPEIKKNFLKVRNEVLINEQMPFEVRADIINCMEQLMVKYELNIDLSMYVPNYVLIKVKCISYYFLI